ncbi:MAG: DNA cytosine methyltransferase [Geminicoccaceae bacterium]
MHAVNFVRRFRPRWTVIENVIQMRSWSRYGELLDLLEEVYGQDGVSVQVLDAADFGVPQTRRRLFIFCDREAPPPRLDRQSWNMPQTVQSILDPPGTWPSGPLRSTRRATGTLERAHRGIAALGEGRPFLVVYYGSDGAGGWQPLDRPLRTMTTLDRFGLVEWDAGEPTLRMLQVPELRRAMGFDDGFRLSHGTRREQIKLLGNGVCPPVMRAIVSALTGAESDRSLKLVA